MKILHVGLIAMSTLMLAGCPGQIVEYPEQIALTKEGIKEALTGDDFRKKTAAREQIEKLSAADRLELLKELLAEGDAPTRMIAIFELMKLPEETWRPLLADVAANDPDPEVKELAGMMVEVEEDDEDEEEPAPSDSEAVPEAAEAPAE